jgi:hypothetical protein
LVVGSAAAGCSRSAPNTVAAGNEIENLLTEVDAGRVRSRSRVRVTGVVTDDDAERRLAYIADTNRAIAVHTAPGGLAAAQGQRVTIDARRGKPVDILTNLTKRLLGLNRLSER